MDKVPSHLRNLILFINQNSQFSVFSVELEYYTHEDYEFLIPHVYGAESKKKLISVSERKKWDEESFFKAAEKEPEAYDPLKKLYNYSKKQADEITWGTGALIGSFNPKFHKISARSLFTAWSDGSLSLNFGWLDNSENTLLWRDRFRNELKEIKPIAEYIQKAKEKYPIVPPKLWTSVVDEFIEVVSKLLD